MAACALRTSSYLSECVATAHACMPDCYRTQGARNTECLWCAHRFRLRRYMAITCRSVPGRSGAPTATRARCERKHMMKTAQVPESKCYTIMLDGERRGGQLHIPAHMQRVTMRRHTPRPKAPGGRRAVHLYLLHHGRLTVGANACRAGCGHVPNPTGWPTIGPLLDKRRWR